MNVKLFRKIQREIKKEPRRFNMEDWVDVHARGHNAPPCHTTACIAGWATVLSRPFPKSIKSFAAKARRLDLMGETYKAPAQDALGITDAQADRLFYVSQWPIKFAQAYDDAYGDPKAQGKIAIARIDHFIKTKGRS